jgi:hypothetical protein
VTRNRWIALSAGIFLFLVVLGIWVARNTTWQSVDVPMPAKGEARTNPFYAAKRFAEALGATTSWEHALGSASGDAVLFLSNFHWSLIPSRRHELEHWVERGGRLVADADLLDNEEFTRWSGITRELPKRPATADGDTDDGRPNAPATILDARRPERCHDLQDGGQTRYRLCQYVPRSWLASRESPTWSLRSNYGIQAVRIRIGRGTVTALNASPFGNTLFTDGDHARLFVAMTELRRKDEVHFISENESPSLITLIWRTGAPVVVLFGIWLALTLWRGGVRFGPLAPRAELVRRSLAEQIRGTAHFALRIGDNDALHRATLRALSRAAQRRIPGYLALDTDARVAAIARRSTVDATALSAAITAVDLRRVHDLRNAVAILETARRELLLRSTRRSHGTQ